MGSGTLALDTILSAMNFHVKKWSPDLVRTQSRDLLRFLTIRLYNEGKGSLQAVSFTISQSALADKIGVSREWCNRLLSQLQEEGWISYSSGRREGGLRTICSYTIGNMLRRLLVMLMKSHAKKNQQKQVVKSSSQFLPFFPKKQNSFVLQKEKEVLKPEIIIREPILKRWLERGTK